MNAISETRYEDNPEEFEYGSTSMTDLQHQKKFSSTNCNFSLLNDTSQNYSILNTTQLSKTH
jgi:hypothetical protein